MTMLNPMTEAIRMIADFKIRLIETGECHASFHTSDVDVSALQFKLGLLDGVSHRHTDGELVLKFSCEKACKRFLRTLGTFTKFKTLSDNRLGM